MEFVFTYNACVGAALLAVEASRFYLIPPVLYPFIYWHRLFYVGAWLLPNPYLYAAIAAAFGCATVNGIHGNLMRMTVDIVLVVVCMWRSCKMSRPTIKIPYASMIYLILALIARSKFYKEYDPVFADLLSVITWMAMFVRDPTVFVDLKQKMILAVIIVCSFAALIMWANDVPMVYEVTIAGQLLFIMSGIMIGGTDTSKVDVWIV